MTKAVIRDGQITASSRFDVAQRASGGRLHRTVGGWRPLVDESQWFQVDFQDLAIVTSIFTQGLSENDVWTDSFIVSFGNDGQNFQDYLEHGKAKVIKATCHIDSLLFSEFNWLCSHYATRP